MGAKSRDAKSAEVFDTIATTGRTALADIRSMVGLPCESSSTGALMRFTFRSPIMARDRNPANRASAPTAYANGLSPSAAR